MDKSFTKTKHPDDLRYIKNVHMKVDIGWRYFWKKRGIDPPPPISWTHLGNYELPKDKNGLKPTG